MNITPEVLLSLYPESIYEPMSDEAYRKCRTCRFCIHSEEIWVCSMTDHRTDRDGTCGRYRPGSCENCRNLDMTAEGNKCTVSGEEMDTLDVCDYYVPCGRRSV